MVLVGRVPTMGDLHSVIITTCGTAMMGGYPRATDVMDGTAIVALQWPATARLLRTARAVSTLAAGQCMLQWTPYMHRDAQYVTKVILQAWTKQCALQVASGSELMVGIVELAAMTELGAAHMRTIGEKPALWQLH
eukprot:TRINITY_DN29759_c0_g1_i1.p2 TRINITY_DN29759_c0_g1~~TRINITY_DN29759_c0_g1_i1.p2  ORF type:complete len:136 (-),score=11.48 TRINITY_DN29759_c0_g1_i1:355-762(-)